MARQVCKLVLLALLGAVLLPACGGSPPVTTGPRIGIGVWWPPETPRHPERLVLTDASITDPLVWWKVNIFDPLPANVYERPEWASYAAAVIKETNKTRARYGL